MCSGGRPQDARTDVLWLPAYWHQLDLDDVLGEESNQSDASRGEELK